jgi:hypothetical protein
VWRVACGVWRVACGVWRVACGVWRVACGVWRVACGVWRVAKPLVYRRQWLAESTDSATHLLYYLVDEWALSGYIQLSSQ